MRGLLQCGLLLAALAGASVCWAAPATATPEGCQKLRLHGKNADAADCFEALTRSGDAYQMAEGYWGLAEGSGAPWQQTKQCGEQANKEFKAAVAQPKSPALWKVRWGMLFYARSQPIDAAAEFRDALTQDPGNAQAYLGLAMLSADGFDEKAPEYAVKAVAADPKLAEANEFLANLALEDEKTDEAVKEADAALALAPDALDAMAVHAAVALLADKNADADAWLAKIKAVNPGYGEGYAIVARHLVLNRRYPDAVAYDRKAIEADPRNWRAHSDLGINLMRLGQEDEPIQQLELAYNNGRQDLATRNSLRLLDSYKNFVTYRDDTTILRLNKSEADLLKPYFEEKLHKAIATYSKKYKMTLSGPVQLEVYPDHEDFAVRTMGMPGLGALGVTFGNVVAMDSPSGRKPGDFNWGATMWHEMSHVFILSATNYRVPRWFTEGLAVHEEGQADARWANRLTPEVVAAIRDKKLLPVTKMDQGFIFPEYPEQVLGSYYQAGTIVDYISEKWGNDALLGMVQSVAALKTTPEVIKLYPEYVDDANAYEFLAAAEIDKGNKQAALDALAEYERRGGEDPMTLRKLASLEEELGHPKEAADTLDQLNFIYPEDENMHRKLGELWLAQGNNAGAVREYSAVLAMKPLDTGSAHYDLAKAYLAEGDKARAEEQVLGAREAAPGFKPAQKMLLEIEGK